MIDLSQPIDVAIIGGGPSGLAAATELKMRGVKRVVILEREPQAGGIPRHCGHPPFGMREFTRVLTGPEYAKRLAARAIEHGVEIICKTSVVEIKSAGQLLIISNDGPQEISATRVIYATGVREAPRSARVIGGQRPLGVLNTGALQSMVFLKGQKPFKRPVIVGTELVSFSAIQTCRHMGIKPVAMLEDNNRATARWPVALFAPLMRIPLHYETSITNIIGNKRVEAVEVVDGQGRSRIIECDGVLLTGEFTPESSLGRCGHLAIDHGTAGPAIDQYGRCSDPTYFACGNLLRPVETAGWSWREGQKIGGFVADDLAGELPDVTGSIEIVVKGDVIKYATPQRLNVASSSNGLKHLQLRLSQSAKVTLQASFAGKTIWQKNINSHRERRILIPISALMAGLDGEGDSETIVLTVKK